MNKENTLSRFNGEYLKCIVTTHSGMIEALKNKGALIIYQTKENNTLRNYVYLGNEFLASGYGFKSKDELTTAEYIVKSYEKDNKEINNHLTSLDESVNSIITTVDYKLNNFRPDLIIYDSNKNEINLNDVYFHGKPAYYEDFEVISIQKKLKYFDGNIINNNTVIEKEKEIDITDVDSIDLPIGTRISSINYIISYNKHDSNGINNVNICYYESSNDYINNNLKLQTYQEKQFNTNAETGKLYINLIFSDPYIVSSMDSVQLINSIQVTVKETPESKYKVYPELNFTNKKYVIFSLENIITEHEKIILKSFYIRGISYLSYFFGEFNFNEDAPDETKYSLLNIKNALEKPIYINETLNYDKSLVYIEKTNYGDISDIYIDLKSNRYNVYTFCISKSYELHLLEYITFNSEYNWTGATGLYKKVEQEIVTDYTTIPIAFNELSTINCKIYQIKLLDVENPMQSTGKLHLRLICNSENPIEDVLMQINGIPKSEPIENLNIDNNYIWDCLINDEFNCTHWIKYNENQYTLDVIKNKLQYMKTDY